MHALPDACKDFMGSILQVSDSSSVDEFAHAVALYLEPRLASLPSVAAAVAANVLLS